MVFRVIVSLSLFPGLVIYHCSSSVRLYVYFSVLLQLRLSHHRTAWLDLSLDSLVTSDHLLVVVVVLFLVKELFVLSLFRSLVRCNFLIMAAKTAETSK